MSVYADDEQVVYETNIDDKQDLLEDISSQIDNDGEPPTATMEAEKRMRREIANSNERRRMQSINNGFQSLKSLLPHHEGEKLSKAAILQQTAEYIYSLEQEKTRLLSQNCQLKRLVNQHEGGELPPKKRKTATTELILPTATESSDEGLGSMSPEPVGIINVTVQKSNDSTVELRASLERERNHRIMLEQQIRQFENQLYQQQQQTSLSLPLPTPPSTLQQSQIYQVDENDELSLQLVTPECLPPVGHTQTVVCSPPISRSPSPEPEEEEQKQRLPSVLEAAIKAEPKVEVERLPSPNPAHDETSSSATTTTTITATGGATKATTPNRLYVSNTSRQNLETIVEAIRHLEGDHMFGDEPLALTTTGRTTTSTTTTTTVQEPQQQPQQQQKEQPDKATIKAEMDAFLDFRTTKTVQQHQQSRPGVIVVKQAS